MADLDPIDFSSPAPAAESGLVEPATKQKACFQIDTRDKAKSDRDEVVCKHQKRTDSRFTTKTCRTRAQWDEMAEQQKRDYAETRNRPVIETRKDN